MNIKGLWRNGLMGSMCVVVFLVFTGLSLGSRWMRPGDFNFDHSFGVIDAEMISKALNDSSTHLMFDLDGSGVVASNDGFILIEDIIGRNRGDFNLDGQTDVADLSIWAIGFGTTDPLFTEGDADFDGDVDEDDQLVWGENFGQ